MDNHGINITLKKNASNEFIIQTLVKALPFANSQMKREFTVRSKNATVVIDSAQTLPATLGVSYKADSWQNQNIQLPSSLLKTKIGDCKSFALLIAGYLQNRGVENGLVFCAYEPGSNQATHVYNYAVLNGHKVYIDGTVKADRIPISRSKEKLKFFKMNVNLMAGSYDEDSIGRRTKEQRKEKRAERKAEGKGLFQGAKKVLLVPARAAFLAVVLLNIRGLATRLKKANDKKADLISQFWRKVGGDPAKLVETINSGSRKKRISGSSDQPIGMAVAAAIATATPIIIAVSKLLKGMKVESEPGGDITDLISPGSEELPAEFTVTDPDPGSNYKPTRNKPDSTQQNSGFEASLPLLAGGGLLLYLLTSKK